MSVPTIRNYSGRSASASQPSQPLAAVFKNFGKKTVQSDASHLRVFRDGTDRLLTVRETAARLSVTTATIYALCERGELPHIRVSNAIRISPEDLAAFIGRSRRQSIQSQK